MWSSRLFWRILLWYGILSLLVAILCLVIVTRWHRGQMRHQVEQRLYDTAVMFRALVRDRVDRAAPGEFQPLVQELGRQTGTRLTLIDAQGRVLADSLSAYQRMDNHFDREEIQQARRQGRGTAQRTSTTLDMPMLYVALQIPAEQPDQRAYVRVAMSTESIDQQMRGIERQLWLIVVIVGLIALVITYVITKRIIRPLQLLTRSAQAIAAGQYGHRVQIASRDEIGMLGDAFEKMRDQLDTQVKQLSEQTNRQATVLRSMREGIFVVDSQCKVTLANQAAIGLLNFSTHQPETKPLRKVINSRPIVDAVNQVLQGNETQETEVEVRGSEPRIVSLQATRLPGQPCPGVVAVVRDVTELRKLENMRRDFAANVSHELKTPLTSIKAYAETLRLGAVHDQENNMNFLIRIEEQAERLHQLILDLLQLSRIESGAEVLELRDVSLSEVVTQSISSYEAAASAKDITISVDPPAGPMMVHVDEEGVRTVLDNLIDNAIKYTPEGGQVTVRWFLDGDMVVAQVQDTGIGIAREELDRIFERFYRVDKARSRALGGTGLGLSIVKHMTQSLGGTVTVRSEPDVGSTFEIRLPMGIEVAGPVEKTR